MAQQSHYWSYTLRKPCVKRFTDHTVYCSTIYNSQDMEATTSTSTDRSIDMEVAVDIYNGILLNHKSIKFKSVAVRWMHLASVSRSEVSQKENKKYCTVTHLYGIQKMVLMNLFAAQEQRHMQRKEVDTASDGERGTN